MSGPEQPWRTIIHSLGVMTVCAYINLAALWWYDYPLFSILYDILATAVIVLLFTVEYVSRKRQR